MRWLSIILFLCTLSTGFSQVQSDSIQINDIILNGLDKTKRHIVLRELDFQPKDNLAITDTSLLFLKSKNKIFNTGLFITVEVRYENSDVVIDLKERWYIFPIPIIELADRNFNEWWQQRGRKLNRLEYGVKLYHHNMRGRNEELKLVLQQGFTPKYELFYTIPYINKKLKTGLKFSISYSQNKQVAYATIAHKLGFVEGENHIRKRFYTGLTLIKRSQFYTTHKLNLFYRNNRIGDTIVELNPNYFINGNTKANYFELSYSFDQDKRDIQYYPLNGYRLTFQAKKLGLGITDDLNIWQLYGSISGYKELGNHIYIGGKIKGKISGPEDQPFFNFRSLGYNEDYVRGYELFPIDGQHYIYSRNSIKKRIFHKDFKFKLPFTHFEYIPFSSFLKFYTDYGYVNDLTQPFNNIAYSNTFLLGYGVGIDFVTYYDIVFRTEYSFTRHGSHGLFLHFEAAF